MPVAREPEREIGRELVPAPWWVWPVCVGPPARHGERPPGGERSRGGEAELLRGEVGGETLGSKGLALGMSVRSRCTSAGSVDVSKTDPEDPSPTCCCERDCEEEDGNTKRRRGRAQEEKIRHKADTGE
jgi:hypothetical protein